MNELPTDPLITPPFPSFGVTEGVELSTQSAVDPEKSRFRKVLTGFGWTALGLASFVLFTLIKVPEDRLKAYVVGTLNTSLSAKGLTLSAERGDISFGWGISYLMRDVKLTSSSGAKPFLISKISIKPNLLPLIWGKQGGSAKVVSSGDGELWIFFSMKEAQISADVEFDNFDVGQTGLLYLLSGTQGSLVATGKLTFNGDWNVPSTVQTQGSVELKKIRLDAQSIQGFQVPVVQLQEGRFSFETDKSKILIRALKLGKPASTDDIQANGTGEISLSRTWDTSPVDLKLNFKFSESITKSFVFLDALLGAGKKPDGSYSYQLTGPLAAPQFQPQP